jgi:hypothetical protein
MYLANGLIIVGIWLSVGFHYSWEPWIMILVSPLVGLATVAGQFRYCSWIRKKALPNEKQDQSKETALTK